jgi:hypothetical protein
VPRGRRPGGEEPIDQDLGDAGEGLAVDAVLRAAGGRRRGGREVPVGHLAGGESQGGVGAEDLVVVEILVARRDRRDPLRQHRPLIVDQEHGVTRVGDGRVEGVEEAEAVGDLAEQQRA